MLNTGLALPRWQEMAQRKEPPEPFPADPQISLVVTPDCRSSVRRLMQVRQARRVHLGRSFQKYNTLSHSHSPSPQMGFGSLSHPACRRSHLEGWRCWDTPTPGPASAPGVCEGPSGLAAGLCPMPRYTFAHLGSSHVLVTTGPKVASKASPACLLLTHWLVHIDFFRKLLQKEQLSK